MIYIAAIVLLIRTDIVLSHIDKVEEIVDEFHPLVMSLRPSNKEEMQQSYWIDKARGSISKKHIRNTNEKKKKDVAKNIIMFLGDGMSIPTLAAARTLLGQRNGKPEGKLSFEDFPYVGLAKTYCVDQQIPDSACTATAYLSGVKNNYGTIGVSAAVNRSNCTMQADPKYHTESIASWALKAGMEVGIVSTAKITDASPAGTYAHIADRRWEDDDRINKLNGDSKVCSDIAYQLVHDYPGNRFKVILGGGRTHFRDSKYQDEDGLRGSREDDKDLIRDWSKSKNEKNATWSYVWNKRLLKKVDVKDTDYLLGIFNHDCMPFNMDRDENTPSLEELTEIAIKMLEKSKKGYFLFVEGARIDHGHHKNQPQRALDETIELHKAVQLAVNMTRVEDTLIVVTSDHAHVMTFNGYADRGKDVLGPSDKVGLDKVPYMTLSYANGPGFRRHASPGVRKDVTLEDYKNKNFQYPAEVPLISETHGGDDVAVFARGPHDCLFTGVYEQYEIPHFMAFAACINSTGPMSCRNDVLADATISN